MLNIRKLTNTLRPESSENIPILLQEADLDLYWLFASTKVSVH